MEIINQIYDIYTENKSLIESNKFICLLPCSYIFFKGDDNTVDYERNFNMITEKIQNKQEQDLSLKILELIKAFDKQYKPEAYTAKNFKQEYFKQVPFVYQDQNMVQGACFFIAKVDKKQLRVQTLRKTLGNYPNLLQLLQTNQFKLSIDHNVQKTQVPQQIEELKSLIIEAQAGAGKTTRLISYFNTMKCQIPKFQALFLVFNKENQLQTKNKFISLNDNQIINVSTYAAYMQQILINNEFNLMEVKIDMKLITDKSLYEAIYYYQEYSNNNLFIHIFKKYNDLCEQEEYKYKYKDLPYIINIYNEVTQSLNTQDDYLKALQLADKIYENQEKYEYEVIVYAFVMRSIRRLYRKRFFFLQTIPLFCQMLLQDPKEDLILREGIQYLFLDEVQDISYSELTLIESLIKINKDIKPIIVGDRNQAIYQFRGCVKDVFYELKKLLENQDIKYDEEKLQKTYRCGSEVVEYTNNACKVQMIAHNKYKFERVGYNHTYKEELKNVFNSVMQETVRLNISNGLERKIVVLSNTNQYVFELNKYLDLDELNKQHPNLRIIIKDNLSKEIVFKSDGQLRAMGTNRLKLMRHLKAKKIDKQEANTIIIEFSTVHKYKGLENQQVIYLNERRYQDVEQDEQNEQSEQDKIQTNNMLYVGLTRAKNHLEVINLQS